MLVRSLLLVLLAYAGFVGLVWLFAERLIFLPPREGYARTPEMLLIPRDGGGSIAAVHLRNPHARYTILFSHGNGEDLGTTWSSWTACATPASRCWRTTTAATA